MALDTFAAFEAAVNRAEEQARRGDFAAALDAYSEVVRERLLLGATGGGADSSLSAADLLVIERLVDYATLLGHVEAGDDLLSGLASLSERAGNLYAADYFRLKRAHLSLGRGRARRAWELLREMDGRFGDPFEIEFSARGFERVESGCAWPGVTVGERLFLFSLFYLTLGRVLSSLGQYGNALAALGRGARHAGARHEGGGAVATAHLRAAVAAALMSRGDFDQLRLLLAADLPSVSESGDPGLYVNLLEISGKLALLAGDFGRALDDFRKVCTTCERYGFARASLSAAANLAHVLIIVNQTGEARRLLEASASVAEALGERRATQRAAFLLRLAHERLHSPARRVPLATSVTELWQGGAASPPPVSQVAGCGDDDDPDDYLELFERRALEFHAELGAGRVEAAGDVLAAMKECFEATDSPLIRARLRLLAGVDAYYRGEINRAEADFAWARGRLKESGLRPELWQAQRFLGWCWLRLDRPARERNELAEDTQRLLDSLTASLRPADRAVFLLNKWTAGEEYLASEIGQLSALKDELSRSTRLRRPLLRLRLMKRLHRLLGEIDRYKDTLSKRAVGAAADGDATPDTSKSAPTSFLRRLCDHPRDRATLAFLVLPDGIFIARSSLLSLDFGFSAVSRLEVRELVRAWHEVVKCAAVARRGGATRDLNPAELDGRGEAATLAAVSRRLADALQLPQTLRTLRTGVRALRIVPDDCLQGFPFAALSYEGRYLIERFAITFAFESGRVRRAAEGGRGALTVGVSKGARGYAGLPAVAAELGCVGAWLARRGLCERSLSDSGGASAAVSKTRVLELLPGAAFAHIACHGVFKPDRPDHSGMVLVTQDGSLDLVSLRELSGLRLEGLRHITLSLCWSADQFILPGRWVIGLPETLYRAGAESVLGCLWVIDDFAGASFMARFYQYLDEFPRQEALRLTQRDALQNRLGPPGAAETVAAAPPPDTSGPLYWAGFHLYGDGGVLKL